MASSARPCAGGASFGQWLDAAGLALGAAGCKLALGTMAGHVMASVFQDILQPYAKQAQRRGYSPLFAVCARFLPILIALGRRVASARKSERLPFVELELR